MSINLELIEEIKENIKKSDLKDDKKANIINAILELESNLSINKDLENEYSKSHITFDVYITRKKMLTNEQIKIKDRIQNLIIKDVEKILESNNEGIISRLKRSIDENVNWIAILLSVTQILVR